MANSPPSSPTAAVPMDNNVVEHEDLEESELVDMNMLLASVRPEGFNKSLQEISYLSSNDKVLQGLNESRSDLLSRVQSLKEDLQHWRGKLDTEVNSYNEEIGDLKNSLNSDVEQLKNEFQELRNTLKEQLAVTTSKLAELDTSVIDCAQYLEGLNVHCELEKSLFDDLIADLGLQDISDSTGENQVTFDYSSSDAPVTTVTIEEVLE